MGTRTLIAFLLATYLFVSCSKSDPNPSPIHNAPPNTFTISGNIHELTMDSSGYAILPLVVAAATGDSQQRVTMWVSSGLRGIYASPKHNTGTTDFNTSVTFSYAGVYDTGAPGTYPVKVIGASASDTETYDCNLTVPPFNGFTLSGAFMRTASMSHTANTVTITSQVYGGTLVGDNPEPWPTADGTYTYMVGAAAGSGLNFSYTAKNSSGASHRTHGRGGGDTAVVTISGGKMSIKSGSLYTYTGNTPFIITINARE